MPACYQYVQVRRRRHPVVAAYSVIEKGDIVHVTLGVSFCSNKDQFSKKLGRTIAEGRMQKNGVQFTYNYNREADPCFGKILSREVAKFIQANSYSLSTIGQWR